MIGRSHPGSSGATTTDLVGVTPVAAEAFQHGDVRLVVQSFDDGSTERAADGPPSGPRSVGLTAVRLERIDRSRTSGDARSPFLALLDIARTLTLTTHLTVWLRWNGTTTPSFEAVLMVATIDDVDARETRSMAQLALNLLDAPSSPWTVTSVDASTLDLPTAGDVRFVRQTPAEHRADDRPTVPSRFRDPGPDAWNRLIASMAVSPDRLDLFVTVTPTELRPDEEREVDLVDLASADDAHRPSRLHATVENAVASYRAETSVVQVMLVGESTMPDAIVGAIASSITAPFDTVNGNGVRVVASSRELVGGGCTVDPARRPELALRMMATGRPWRSCRSSSRGLAARTVCFPAFPPCWRQGSTGPGTPTRSNWV